MVGEPVNLVLLRPATVGDREQVGPFRHREAGELSLSLFAGSWSPSALLAAYSRRSQARA